MKKIFYKVKSNIGTLLLFGVSGFIIWRFNTNFDKFEEAIKKEKIFDAKKANEQLKIYKELYDPTNDIEKRNRLYNAASEEDKAKLSNIFSKYDNMDKESIQNQIDKLKRDIEFLEDKKTTHQGVKLAKLYHGYEPSEEALKKIRQNYVENRKKIDKTE
mgnify:CR=1 FL=1